MRRFLRLFAAHRQLEAGFEVLRKGSSDDASKYVDSRKKLDSALSEIDDLRREVEEHDATRDQLRQDLIHERAVRSEMENRNLRMQDHLVSMEAQHGQMLSMVESAHKAETHALQSLINFDSQTRYGVAVFPEAAKLPTSRLPSADSSNPIQSDVVRPSSMVAEAKRKFTKDLRDRLEKQVTPSATD